MQLVDARKVSFQRLKAARQVYQDSFGIDLRGVLSKPEWDTLGQAFKWRHAIIHNAGFDENFEQVVVEPAFLARVDAACALFLERVDKAARKAGVY